MFLVPKKWLLKASNKSLPTQSICHLGTLQDGKHSLSGAPNSGGGLDVKDRSQGCIFFSPNPQGSSEMATLPMARPRISVSLPPFWPIFSPPCIHKDHTPNSGMAETTGSKTDCIDDFLLLAPSKEEASIQAHLMTMSLQVLGFSVNNEKSILTPCQEIEFLGVVIQSHSPALHLSQHKLQVLKSRAQQLLKKDATHQTIIARDLAQFIGTANAAALAIPPAPLFCRSLQLCQHHFQKQEGG